VWASPSESTVFTTQKADQTPSCLACHCLFHYPMLTSLLQVGAILLALFFIPVPLPTTLFLLPAPVLLCQAQVATSQLRPQLPQGDSSGPCSISCPEGGLHDHHLHGSFLVPSLTALGVFLSSLGLYHSVTPRSFCWRPEVPEDGPSCTGQLLESRGLLVYSGKVRKHSVSCCTKVLCVCGGQQWGLNPGPLAYDIFACFFIFETGCHYLAQADLKLLILLPQPPGCWDYRCAPPGLAFT
jgi:hypothetical protein